MSSASGATSPLPSSLVLHDACLLLVVATPPLFSLLVEQRFLHRLAASLLSCFPAPPDFSDAAAAAALDAVAAVSYADVDFVAFLIANFIQLAKTAKRERELADALSPLLTALQNTLSAVTVPGARLSPLSPFASTPNPASYLPFPPSLSLAVLRGLVSSSPSVKRQLFRNGIAELVRRMIQAISLAKARTQLPDDESGFASSSGSGALDGDAGDAPAPQRTQIYRREVQRIAEEAERSVAENGTTVISNLVSAGAAADAVAAGDASQYPPHPFLAQCESSDTTMFLFELFQKSINDRVAKLTAQSICVLYRGTEIPHRFSPVINFLKSCVQRKSPPETAGALFSIEKISQHAGLPHIFIHLGCIFLAVVVFFCRKPYAFAERRL
jgi:hypothetical protein